MCKCVSHEENYHFGRWALSLWGPQLLYTQEKYLFLRCLENSIKNIRYWKINTRKAGPILHMYLPTTKVLNFDLLRYLGC